MIAVPVEGRSFAGGAFFLGIAQVHAEADDIDRLFSGRINRNAQHTDFDVVKGERITCAFVAPGGIGGVAEGWAYFPFVMGDDSGLWNSGAGRCTAAGD